MKIIYVCLYIAALSLALPASAKQQNKDDSPAPSLKSSTDEKLSDISARLTNMKRSPLIIDAHGRRLGIAAPLQSFCDKFGYAHSMFVDALYPGARQAVPDILICYD